jgi:hypothetical protein
VISSDSTHRSILSRIEVQRRHTLNFTLSQS